MANYTASPEAVVSFVTQLGLSPSDVSQVSTALANAAAFGSIGLLALSLLFPHLTFWPDSANYTAIQQVNWSTRAWLPAALIFTPDTTDAVSKGVKVTSYFGIEFSVRGGGHMHFPGAASSDGGLLIAMEKLSSLSLDEAKKVVSIGAGNRWISVYQFLEPYGLAAVGGRVPVVGVAGLLTGGGNSFYTTSHGMACDTIKSLEVVLASGKVVTASAKQNWDLFKALKGGGNNFGIVTRFDLHTVPQPKGVWAGLTTYTPDKFGSVIDTLVTYQDKHQVEDPKAAMIQNAIFTGGSTQIWMSFLFHAETDNPASLQDWKTLGPMSDTTNRTTLAKFVNAAYSGQGVPAPGRQHMSTISIGVDAELYKEVLAQFNATFTAANVPGLQVTLTYQPMAVSTVRHGKKMGGNVLGVKEEAQTWLDITSSWSDAAYDETVIGSTTKLIADIEVMAKKRGLYYDYMFLNDAGEGQKIIESYGEANVKFLKVVAKKYDPTGVFQKLSKGGFKLP